jgi:FkbM family methyltransferase
VKLVRNSYIRIRRAVHVLRGTDLWQRAQVKENSVLLGNGKACWRVCASGLSKDTIVYSMGVGEDVSFELDLIRRFGVQVYAFDPTPRSVDWVKAQVLPGQFVFHPYGIADYDGTCKFHPPENPFHVSHTLLDRESKKPSIELPVHRLDTIMTTLGHSRVDVLKMDIEGAEYTVLRDIIRAGVRTHQLLVEFHHRWPEVGVEQTRWAIHELNSIGYKIFSVSPSGEEYGFLNGGV